MIGVSARRSPRSEGVRGPAVAAGARYCDAITRAGGLPLLLDPEMCESKIAGLPHRLDGLVLTGGGDLDPRRYGGDPSDVRLRAVNADLDSFEICLADAAVEADIPILAICRGMQILNVVLGGSLHLDVSDNAAEPRDHADTFHDVDLLSGSRIAAVFGERARRCHSVHHQCIRTVGDGLRATGRHADGVIEAIELSGARWVVGVQWHPEDTATTDASQQRLFDTFVAATRANTRLQPID